MKWQPLEMEIQVDSNREFVDTCRHTTYNGYRCVSNLFICIWRIIFFLLIMISQNIYDSYIIHSVEVMTLKTCIQLVSQRCQKCFVHFSTQSMRNSPYYQ